jgi:hypothetical protein
MLGFDDFLLILGATTLANLAVEVGAEIIAEWWVHAPQGSSPFEPGTVDPSAASEPIRYAPELLTQISAKVDQTAVWSERTADGLGAQVGERLSAKFDQAAAWSERTADSLGAQVGERLTTKFDQAAVWSGQVMEKLSVKADALSVKAAETALWSEQMIIGPLTTSLGLQ